MANILENIKQRASALGKTIVLPEGEDSRVVKAAAQSVKEGLAKITLLGNLEEIKKNNPDVCFFCLDETLLISFFDIFLPNSKTNTTLFIHNIFINVFYD